MKKSERLIVCGCGLLFATRLGAIPFPASENGVITLTAGTYDAGLIPESVTKVVKTGDGEAKIAVDSPSFVGMTEVRAGTLTLTTHQALGPVGQTAVGGDVEVFDGATLCLAWPGIGQRDYLWTKRVVTVAGTGVDGAGAISIDPSTSGDSMNDHLFGTIRLNANACIASTARWGFDVRLELGGHTFTYAGKGELMYRGCVAGPGNVIADANGTFLTSLSFEGFAGENVSRDFTVRPNASVKLYAVQNPIPFDFTLMGGAKSDGTYDEPGRIFATSGNARNLNVITGDVTLPDPADVKNGIFNMGDAMAGTCMTWAGKTVQNAFMLFRGNANKPSDPAALVISGPFEGAASEGFAANRRVQVSDNGRVIFANGAEVTNAYLTALVGGNGQYVIEGGLLHLKALYPSFSSSGIYSCSRDASPTRVMGGHVSLTDALKVLDRTNAYGALYLEGGELSCDNGFDIGTSEGSFGFLVQRGGWLSASDKAAVNYGTGGCSVYCQDGGTNDVSKADGSRYGLLGSGQTVANTQLLSIRGAGALFKTDNLIFDYDDNGDRFLNFAVADEGVLSVRRLFRRTARTGTTNRHAAFFYFDGGVLEVRFSNSLVSQGSDKPEFYLRSPDHFVVGPKGLVIDTTHSRNSVGNLEYSEIPFDIEKPVGKGLSKIVLPDTEAFKQLAYQGPAWIEIEGDGTGAAAFADWDFETSRLVVRITNPGFGYTEEKTRVRIVSPETLTDWYDCGFELAEQTCGPVEIRGAGGAALYGSNTFVGGLVVARDSRLRIYGSRSVPSGTDLIVHGTLDVWTNGVVLASLAGSGTITCVSGTAGDVVTLAEDGAIRVRAADLFKDDATPLRLDQQLTLSAGVKIVIEDPENLPEIASRHTFLKAGRLNLAESSLPPVVDANGESLADKVVVRRCGNEMRLGIRRGLAIILR